MRSRGRFASLQMMNGRVLRENEKRERAVAGGISAVAKFALPELWLYFNTPVLF